MKRFAFIALLSVIAVAAASADAIRFISPVSGNQMIGVQTIAIETTITHVDRVDFYVDGDLAGAVRQPPYSLVHDFGTSTIGHEITARVYSDSFEHSAWATISTSPIGASETINVDVVDVPIRLKTSRRDLTASDFVIRENGVEQKIVEFNRARGAATFYFVVDRSASMGDGKLSASLSAIDRELPRLRRDDRANLILFNHRVDDPRPLDISRRIESQVEDLTASGGTSMRDALALIHGGDRTIAIVITDGGDRNSELSADAALRRVATANATVYAIALGGGSGSDFLREAATRTGGMFVETARDGIESAVESIFADIDGRYRASYQSSTRERGWRKIEVTSKRRDVRIAAARKGYFAE